MGKLTRVTQRPFGLSGPVGDFAQFGSLAASTKVFSQNPATIQQLSAWLQGLGAATIQVGGQFYIPALEDINGALLVAFYQLCSIFQDGIPEYDISTTYYKNSFCQSNGTIFQSIVDNNTGHTPGTSPTFWIAAPSAAPVGSVYGGVISNSSVSPTNAFDTTECFCKDSTGIFSINFPAAVNTKSVTALWVEGSAQGGLDAGTIGSSQAIVYEYAIGKSTNANAGDILLSKSYPTPDMTRPNAQGYDLYRFIGHRPWSGTALYQFISIGNGPSRYVSFLTEIELLSGGTAPVFTDIFVSDYVNGAICRQVNINMLVGEVHANAVGYVRPKGSTLTGAATAFCQSTNSGGSAFAGATGTVELSTDAVFQYATADSGQPADIYLRGFREEL